MIALPARLSTRAAGLAVAALLVAPLLAGALLATTASPATAHAGLVSSTPESREKVGTMPAEVRMTFNEDMNRPSYVTVTAPDGAIVADGEGAVDGPDVAQSVTDPGLAGTYRVDYRVISADGHPVQGAFEFEVTTGEVVETGAVERLTSSTWWWIALIAVPWVALVALLVLRRRRVRSSHE